MFGRLINKYFQKIRIRIYKNLSSKKIRIEGVPAIAQPVIFNGVGKIKFGKDVRLGYYPSPFFYSGSIYIEARSASAEVIFGNDIYVNNNLTIVCDKSRIEIHDKVLIGTNVEIFDADFHGLSAEKRRSSDYPVKPVVIHRNVFIGSNVKILKGVVVGENSVIANSAVVVNDVPANVIVAGNPAQVIKSIPLD